jgi:xyloglucan:xyloglucosyl transferase
MAARRAIILTLLSTLALLRSTAMATAAADSWLLEKFTLEGHVSSDHDASGRQVASLTLDRQSGGAFRSKDWYHYGEFSIQLRLVRGDSAGTVASFYLASGDNPGHDEIDMEFMGNCTGSPVVLSTNVWANGDGHKEQQFGLWFDPAADFHTYAILWNDRNVVFRVDGQVVRVFNRHPDLPYPGGKPMRVHATIWDGGWWATRHGTVPVDWSHAPFVVSYRGYSAVGCTPMGEGKPLACPAGTARWMKRRPSAADRATLVWARDKYMNYDYCKDGWRFPKGFPAECYRRNH